MYFGSKFGRFIRSGGNGEIVIPWGGRIGLETKADPGDGVSIESLIGHANANNISFLTSFLGTGAQSTIEGVPVEGLKAWVREELRSRLAETGGVGVDEDPVLSGITHQFDAKLNAQRQQALGVSHYIWRSQDDNRVRSTHAARDDRHFRGTSVCRVVFLAKVLAVGVLLNQSFPKTRVIPSWVWPSARQWNLRLSLAMQRLPRILVSIWLVACSIWQIWRLRQSITASRNWLSCLGSQATNGKPRLNMSASESPLRSKTTTSDWNSWRRLSVACPISQPHFWITPMR